MFCRHLGLGRTEGQGLNWRVERIELQVMLNKWLDLQPVPDFKSTATDTIEHNSEISDFSFWLRFRKIRYWDSPISKHKTTISGYINIEVSFFDLENLRYQDTSISKLKTSISKFLRYHYYHTASISEPQDLRYRSQKTSILKFNIVPDIEVNFQSFDIEVCDFDIEIYQYRSSEFRYRSLARFQM